ncbi:MAG: hypothetical protein WBG50_16450 [Desulfomonilaceae bacterium]
MTISSSDRENVYKSLPGNRREIVLRTAIPSYRIPAILRWLKRRRLALNQKKGVWTPILVPTGIDICWEHGVLTLNGACPACHDGGLSTERPACQGNASL